MASESTKDPILELMFEDLEAEERDALRAEIEGDPDQAAELESFELLMGRVREADLVEEVPESVHASIMEAARAGVSRVDAGPRGSRRGPQEESLWSKYAGGGAGQIALVATVLLAAAFVYQVIDPMGAPAGFGDAADAPLSEMQPNDRVAKEEVAAEPEREPTAGFAAAEPVEAEESEESGLADGLEWNAEDGDEVWDQNRAFAEKSKRDEVEAVPEEETLLGGAKSAEEALKEARAPAKRRKSRSRRTRTKSAPSSVASGAELDLAPAADAPSAPSSASGATTERKSASDKGADYLTLDDLAEGESAGAPSDAEGPGAQAEQQAYEPPSGSPAAIQQTYDQRDYTSTLREANEYLGADSGTATDRATVMQLKAASLVALGRYAEADRVYQNIQRAYPNYRPEQISQARSDISRRLDDRKAPKRKAKPSPKKESNIDFSDEQMEVEPSSAY